MKLIIVLFLRKQFFVYDVRTIHFQITLFFSIEITKNRRFRHSVFKLSKDDIVNTILNEYDIFC